jgi:hypothetical protein
MGVNAAKGLELHAVLVAEIDAPGATECALKVFTLDGVVIAR